MRRIYMTSVSQGAFGRIVLADITRPMAEHVHHHFHLLFKVAGQDGECVVSGRRYPMTDDTVILVNAWECHHLGQAVAEKPITVLALYIEPEWLAHRVGASADLRSWIFFSNSCMRLTRRMRQLRELLALCMTASAMGYDENVEDLVAKLAGAFLHGCRSKQNRDPGGHIRRALDIMAEARGNIPEMAMIARQVGLSRSRFFGRFRSCVGSPPTLFANHFRIETATRKLAENGTSIADLSLSLGFSDQPNFTRFFGRHLGVSPGSYRKALSDHGLNVPAVARTQN